jgi:broad specificity phosphatase PhoE
VPEVRSLLLLRHGQTAWNHERRIQGQTDAALDQTGHVQSRAAAKEIAALRPALVWSSDLARARDTATYVGEACGLEVVTDPRLREYHLGSLQGRTYAEIAETDPSAYARFRRGDFGVAGGESSAMVASRMASAIRDLLQATPPDRLSVAVTHGAAIRVGLAEAVGWDQAVGLTLAPLGNCCWALLEESEATGRLQLAAYNREAPSADGADFAPPPSVG